MTNRHFDDLRRAIQNNEFRLAVVGIGRVGLPLALSFASRGIAVSGIDRDPEHVDKVNQGVLPFIEHGAESMLKEALDLGTFHATTAAESAILDADVVILTVGTPLTPDLRADTSQLTSALGEISQCLKPGSLVITRSTLSPGTTNQVVIPTLERLSGLRVGETLFVAFCPERIAEGKAVEELRDLPEIIGGSDDLSTELAVQVFRILGADKLLHRTDPLSAELAKLFTNVYRYVNFALANEYALIAEHYGRDAHHIIEILRDGYARAPIPLPGPTGGPCLSKDGYFLIEELTFPDFVMTAWKLNDSIPAHLVQRLKTAIKRRGIEISTTKIAVLGKAFKADIDDDRLSPALRVIDLLQRLGANVDVHDPYLSDTPLDEVLDGAHGVILATNHRLYYELDMKRIAQLVHPECVLIDAWGVLDPNEAEAVGLELNTFGRG